jgi:hypothetical protein
MEFKLLNNTVGHATLSFSPIKIPNYSVLFLNKTFLDENRVGRKLIMKLQFQGRPKYSPRV